MQKSPSVTEPDFKFAKFMRDYQDMVFSTAFRLTASAPQAEDIAQEVFLKAFAQFEQLQLSPAVGGWLKTVATNLSLNHLTRHRRRWRLFSEMASGDDTAVDDMVDPPFATQTGADELIDAMDAEYRRQLLEAGLAGLPAHQRVPLVLYHFEDMSYDEIAARLGISLPKVKTDLYRARLALARKLLDPRASSRSTATP